jgi:predicted type IV restriction endonuclease
MSAHEAIGVYQTVKSKTRLAEGIKKCLVINIVRKNYVPAATSVYHMIKGMFIFDSLWSWHNQVRGLNNDKYSVDSKYSRVVVTAGIFISSKTKRNYPLRDFPNRNLLI